MQDRPRLVCVPDAAFLASFQETSKVYYLEQDRATSGAMHIAELPEFADAARLGSVLRAVESRTPLDRLRVRSVEGQVAVRVGVDEDRALAGCSLVSYALPGSVHGAVGVLGPLRMDYARTLAVVDAVGSRLADLL